MDVSGFFLCLAPSPPSTHEWFLGRSPCFHQTVRSWGPCSIAVSLTGRRGGFLPQITVLHCRALKPRGSRASAVAVWAGSRAGQHSAQRSQGVFSSCLGRRQGRTAQCPVAAETVSWRSNGTHWKGHWGPPVGSGRL